MNHACEYQRWISRASDVELSRAVVEEGGAFLPEALDAIQVEVARRRLEPEQVIQRYRAWRGRSERGNVRRYVFGGLLMAGLGVVPGLIPRLTQLRVLVLLDNPSDEEVLFDVEGRSFLVAPGAVREATVDLGVEELPLVALARRLSRRREEESADTLTVGIHRRGARGGARVLQVGVADGGRYLVGADPSVAYTVLEQRYRVVGRNAHRLGTPRRAAWSAPGRILDLQLPAAPGGEQVRWVPGSFPLVLELPGRPPDGLLLKRYGLRRE